MNVNERGVEEKRNVTVDEFGEELAAKVAARK